MIKYRLSLFYGVPVVDFYRLAVTSRLLAFAPAVLTHSTLTRASKAQKKLQDDRHTEALDLVTPLHKPI